MHLPETASQQPEAQVLPAQHIWPGFPAVPHAVHTLPELPASPALPELQISVCPPLFEHAVVAATHDPETGSQQSVPRHVLPAQQVWVVAPHVVHEPPVHTSPPVHDDPVATH
jgi:hypothetical protein